MSVREALQVHSAAGTGDGTSAAALAQRGIDHRNAAILPDAVVVDLAGFVGNSAVGAHIGALATAVAAQFVSLGGAGVGLQLILGQQTDDLNRSGTGNC